MPAPLDPVNQKLSMTTDNRHQYSETAMVNASESEREMMQAEARGREHRLNEMALRRKLRNLGVGLLVVLAVVVVVGTLKWLSAR